MGWNAAGAAASGGSGRDATREATVAHEGGREGAWGGEEAAMGGRCGGGEAFRRSRGMEDRAGWACARAGPIFLRNSRRGGSTWLKASRMATPGARAVVRSEGIPGADGGAVAGVVEPKGGDRNIAEEPIGGGAAAE